MGFGAKKAVYETSESDASSLDDLSRKLAVDLRKHVRKLDSYKPFSKEWNLMVDSLMHVSNIAAMEHRLPRSDGADDSTLWEGDELTVRFLLEEGKLNLCLRLMADFKAAARQPITGAMVLECEVHDEAALKARMLVFEQSLGTLLRCAFEHVEAVQTTDLPLLFGHCSQVMQWTLESDEAVSLDRTQEALVGHYLNSCMGRVEELGEGRLVPLILQHNLVPHTVALLSRFAKDLTEAGQLAASGFLAHTFDSETFPGRRAEFIPPETAALLKGFRPLYLARLTEATEVKRKLRPLLDAVVRAGG